jgi:hypothetical protein
MSSRVIYIACARAIWSRHCALVMFFYMCLEKHVCNAMSRGLFIHEHFEWLLVRWRVRATYATDNDKHQIKERFMHESFELLQCELRCVAWPVVS